MYKILATDRKDRLQKMTIKKPLNFFINKHRVFISIAKRLYYLSIFSDNETNK